MDFQVNFFLFAIYRRNKRQIEINSCVDLRILHLPTFFSKTFYSIRGTLRIRTPAIFKIGDSVLPSFACRSFHHSLSSLIFYLSPLQSRRSVIHYIKPVPVYYATSPTFFLFPLRSLDKFNSILILLFLFRYLFLARNCL